MKIKNFLFKNKQGENEKSSSSRIKQYYAFIIGMGFLGIISFFIGGYKSNKTPDLEAYRLSNNELFKLNMESQEQKDSINNYIQYSLENYVNYRESYNFYTVVDNITNAKIMGNSAVNNQLTRLINSKNWYISEYEDMFRVFVTFKSYRVVRDGLVEIVFSKTLFNIEEMQTTDLGSYVAMVSYDFENLKQDDLAKLINPLKIVVDNYDVKKIN